MSFLETKIISEGLTFDNALLIRVCSDFLTGDEDVPAFFPRTIDLEGVSASLQKHKIEYILFHHNKITFKRYDGTPMLLILLLLCLCLKNMGVSYNVSCVYNLFFICHMEHPCHNHFLVCALVHGCFIHQNYKLPTPKIEDL